MAHADWLLRGPYCPPRALCEGNTIFYGPVSFGGKISKLILTENKGLGNVRWKSVKKIR